MTHFSQRMLWMIAFSMVTASFAVTAYAGRTIRIVSPKEGIQLTNPSTIAVSYDVTCYDASGNSVSNQTSQTLAAGATTYHGKGKTLSEFSPFSSVCANGNGASSLSWSNGWSAQMCPGSVTYANASSLCAEGTEICEYAPPNYVTCASTWSSSYFWAKPPAGATMTFNGSSCTWVGAVSMTASDALVIGDSCAGTLNSVYYCSQDNGSTTAYRCAFDAKTSTHGTLCCAKSPATYCRVTINSTDANAFLASPQFKGGSPF